MVSIDAHSESRWNRQIISIESTVNLQVQGVPRKYKFCTPRELYFCKNRTNWGLIAVFLFSTKNVICDLCNSKVPFFYLTLRKGDFPDFIKGLCPILESYSKIIEVIYDSLRFYSGKVLEIKKKSSKWNLKKISLKFSWFCSKF